jgi:curved DNA-binding protein
VLRDPEKRARYDRLGANWRADGAPDAGPGFDPRDFGGFGDGARVEYGSGGDFGDIFEGLFGRRRGGGGGFTREQEAVLELPLREAARGGTRRLTLDGRQIEVQIPPGVRDGQVIRVPGENLLLHIELRPEKGFRLRGDDVETDVAVAPWEAALGASVQVPTLDGSARVKVPAGSSCGRRLRLRGAGLGGGDLYAVVKIVVPKRLSKRERELLRKLADESRFDPRRSA